MSSTTTYYANVPNTGNRASGNPAGAAPYTSPIQSPTHRTHLFIQNKGENDVDLLLSSTGSTIKLYSGSSISIDNYNGGFSLSSYDGASIQEGFAT